jgi:hypothetical protein
VVSDEDDDEDEDAFALVGLVGLVGLAVPRDGTRDARECDAIVVVATKTAMTAFVCALENLSRERRSPL